DKKIYALLLNNKDLPLQVNKDKYSMIKSLLLAIDSAFAKAGNVPQVRKALINSLVQNILIGSGDKLKKFQNKYKRQPPLFLLIAPGKFCNLKCKGCYANSSAANSEKLSWDTLDRIINEKRELWGSYFTVITGGEPLLCKDGGKTIIDLAKKHKDNYFLMYTNGTLINEEMAEKLAEVGE
ncbi:MAG: radical SAM protein, partial [Spirochaetota bacterium]|nr:radical SAM protein [Spirochaetota bacterium]